MPLPLWPEFAPVSLDMRDDLYPALNELPSGISEFTFSNLYLFRGTYGYRLSRHPGGAVIVEGAKLGSSFFYVPAAMPPDPVLAELMERNDYLKNLSEPQAAEHGGRFASLGWEISEDRDNFDYIYSRKELADLVGKTFHKKRNLVNAFTAAYECESRPLVPERI
ncbi:MAG: phosphatidylglycerol lysyltransferase domain-containing protein, partial [Spirochaetota bacterium]